VTSRRPEPGPVRERSFWQLLPRRNFRHALFLLLALLGVLFLRHTGGLSFSKMFDTVAPARPASGGAPAPGQFQHLEVKR
jgi:hypothetical protein